MAADPRIDEAREEKNRYKRRALDAEKQRDALLTALRGEVERARRDADDEQLNEFARQQAELDASYVQTILDTYGGGER